MIFFLSAFHLLQTTATSSFDRTWQLSSPYFPWLLLSEQGKMRMCLQVASSRNPSLTGCFQVTCFSVDICSYSQLKASLLLPSIKNDWFAVHLTWLTSLFWTVFASQSIWTVTLIRSNDYSIAMFSLLNTIVCNFLLCILRKNE